MTRTVALLLLTVLLSGCAAQSYVALQEHPAGSAVTVVKGTQSLTLEQARLGVPLAAGARPFALGALRLQRDFAGALAVQPAPPERFVVYLQADGLPGMLSEQVLDHVLHAARQREHPLVVVTGHTDSLGRKDVNLQLGLQRAQALAERLRARGLQARMQIESLGELDLLVRTADATPEERNRRVVIEVR
ncbi:OmpA family protein [Stutzerimonas stutzeri]